MKRIVAVMLATLMVIAILPVAAAAETLTPVTLTVTTDKKNAKAEETVEFTVTMGPVTELEMQGLQFELDIPAGLTYIPGSGSVTDGLNDTFGAYETSFTDSGSKLIFVCVGGGKYKSNSDTELMKFSCKVDGTVDKKSVLVSLKENLMIGPVDANPSMEVIPTEIKGCKFFIGDFMPGDANGDGEVDLRDAVRITQYYNEWDVEINLAAADANGDGEVDLRDAVRITQYYNEWEVTLG